MSERQFSAKIEHLTPPILSYLFNEVHEKLEPLQLSKSFHMQTQSPDQAREALRTGGYTFSESLEIPTESNGFVDFERIHEPIIDEITKINEIHFPGLSGFEKRYATHGSSDAIFRLMAGWKSTGEMKELGIIKGEYDGYTLDAIGLGIPIHTAESIEEAGEPAEGRVWFTSNPSATDGNWHNQEAWDDFIADHDVVVDTAYALLTADEHRLDVSNAKAVLTSPSKSFGVFRHRYAGVVYTKQEVTPLIDTMWFKSTEGLMNSLALYQSFGSKELAYSYKGKQFLICDAIGRLVGNNVIASDTILLGHTKEELPEEYSLLASRPGTYRFRLSTLFEILEQHEQL